MKPSRNGTGAIVDDNFDHSNWRRVVASFSRTFADQDALAAVFVICMLLLCFGDVQLTAQEIILYDNLDPLRDPDPEAHRWRSWPEHTPEWTVQPFQTGDSDNVSSVTIDFQPKGDPAGELAIEIWDDNGSDRPGKVVGAVGSLDLASLDGHGFPKGGEWVLVTFDNPVVGLSPDSTYYVVLNTTDTVIATNNTVANGFTRSDEGTFGAGWATGGPADGWAPLRGILNNSNITYLEMAVTAHELPTEGSLEAGDADQNLSFDQLDLVKVQIAAKYLSGQAATWGEGDWNGAPGGQQGDPPAGDGLFNQFDIIAAQQGGKYLTGPYAAVQASGAIGDGQTSVIYNTGTGEFSVDAPAGMELTSINIDSVAGIFTGQAAENLGGSFDNDADGNIFKATFGSSFASLSFGNVSQTGLSEEFLLGDLTVIGSLAGGGDLGNVDLVYVPEPTSVVLLSLGLAIGLLHFRRVNP